MSRRLCWFQRGLRTGRTSWSKGHLFPDGSVTALCGQALPRLFRGLSPGTAAVRLAGLIEIPQPAGQNSCGLCERSQAKRARAA